MAIFNFDKLSERFQNYLQIKFQNYRLEAEERLVKTIVAVLISFVIVVTLSVVFLFLNFAVASYLNEIFEHKYWGYLIIVAIHTCGLVFLLILIRFKKVKKYLFKKLKRILEKSFNKILKSIVGQPDKSSENFTEIENIVHNKSLTIDEKQKQLHYIEDRYSKALGESLKSAKKSISNVAITGTGTYIIFRLTKSVFFRRKKRKKKQKVEVVVNTPLNTRKEGNLVIKSIKKKVTDMAVDAIIDAVTEQVQKGVHHQLSKKKRHDK